MHSERAALTTAYAYAKVSTIIGARRYTRSKSLRSLSVCRCNRATVVRMQRAKVPSRFG